MTATDFEREARTTIKEWSVVLDILREREKVVASEIREVQEKIGNMERAIRNYREFHNLPVEPYGNDVLTEKLRTMSVKDMIVTVLEQEGRRDFRAYHVSQRLTEAGMFDNVGQANDNVYAALRRHTRLFEKVSRGWYRLTADGVANPQLLFQEAAPVNGSAPTEKLSSKVKRIKEEHPDWASPQVLAQLQAEGWDFRGKSPLSSVNMAVARLRIGRKGTNGPYPDGGA